MSARNRYDEMVQRLVGAELKATGFRRSRNRFGRLSDVSWQIIDFQASQWGDRDNVRFTINLAVALRELTVPDKWPGKTPPAQHSSQLGVRLGNILYSEDHWWTVDQTTDSGALADQLMDAIRGTALPWLENRRDLPSVLALIETDPGALGFEELLTLAHRLSDIGQGPAADAARAELDRR